MNTAIPSWLKGHTPDSIKFYLDLLRIHDRRENDGEVPDGVEDRRRFNLLQKKIEEHERALKEQDERWLGLAKSFKGVNQITSFLEKITGKKK